MNLKVYIKTFSRNICDFLLLITNRSKAWDNAHLHAWFRVLKIEIIDNNDEKHGRMIESNRWKLCKLWCTFSFAGNLVLKIRVDSSAQHIWGFRVMSFWREALIEMTIIIIFAFVWHFFWLLDLFSYLFLLLGRICHFIHQCKDIQ